MVVVGRGMGGVGFDWQRRKDWLTFVLDPDKTLFDWSVCFHMCGSLEIERKGGRKAPSRL